MNNSNNSKATGRQPKASERHAVLRAEALRLARAAVAALEAMDDASANWGQVGDLDSGVRSLREANHWVGTGLVDADGKLVSA